MSLSAGCLDMDMGGCDDWATFCTGDATVQGAAEGAAAAVLCEWGWGRGGGLGEPLYRSQPYPPDV